MGFVGNDYKILSPPGWDSTQKHSLGGKNESKQQRVVEFVRKWLLCGWHLGSSDYTQVVSPGNKNTSRNGGADGSYVKPPSWKQYLRRMKAKSKKVQTACCEGLCFHPQQQPLNYCNTESYERNFDRGREYWEDYLPKTGLNATNSSIPILWESSEEYGSDPIWHRPEMKLTVPRTAVAAA